MIMHDTEEKFLYEHKDRSRTTKSEKYNGSLGIYMENGNHSTKPNKYKHDSIASSAQS